MMNSLLAVNIIIFSLSLMPVFYMPRLYCGRPRSTQAASNEANFLAAQFAHVAKLFVPCVWRGMKLLVGFKNATYVRPHDVGYSQTQVTRGGHVILLNFGGQV